MSAFDKYKIHIIPVGSILYGFCSGYFGRDSYDHKRIEAVGPDWIVVRNLDTSRVEFASSSGIEENIHHVLAKYLDPKNDPDYDKDYDKDYCSSCGSYFVCNVDCPERISST